MRITKAHECRFLLARLQIDSLVHQTSARNIHKALDNLPEKLNDTFHDALQRIRGQPPEHSTLAEQVISWIFYAKGPLKLAELREALAVEPGDTELDRSGLYEPQLLLNICCGLVTAEGEDGVITLVHYSLQQLLVAFWKEQCPNAEFRMATTCLTYMCFDEFSISLESEEQVRERAKTYQFLDYTSENWAQHVGNGFEKYFESAVLHFLKSDNCLHNVVCVNRLHTGAKFEALPNKTLPLHFTAYCGLTHIMGILIGEGAHLDARTYGRITPLYLAAMYHNLEAALLLLDSGADVDATTLGSYTPPSVAVGRDDSWNVQMSRHSTARPFLENCDLDSKSPISAATERGDYPMVELLLHYGANLNTRSKSEFTPLGIAVDRKDQSIAELLLQHGADPNKSDRDGFTPLESAIDGGDYSMVELLLQHGADPNRSDKNGLTCWNSAVLYKNLRILEILTAARPETDTKEPQATLTLVSSLSPISPLHDAVDLFWEEGIELLIASGADPQCIDVYGQSCLDLAWPFENLFSRLRQDQATYTPTSKKLQRSRLTESVRSLISIIVEDAERHSSSNHVTTYYSLGNCLLQLRDTEEARTSFEQDIDNAQSGFTPEHFADCDNCDIGRISGRRFSCYACPNIDLCVNCMGKYPYEAPNPRCRNHEFLEVPGPYWYDLKERDIEHPEETLVNMRGETLDEWLKRLKFKYSS